MSSTRNIFEGIDFRRNPYRGILRDIAKSEGVKTQTIWAACFLYQNPRIVTLVAQKVKECHAAEKKTKKIIDQITKAAA